jgi:DNA-directed RNA polymerase subunit M/transcription elongation factor TFIIS
MASAAQIKIQKSNEEACRPCRKTSLEPNRFAHPAKPVFTTSTNARAVCPKCGEEFDPDDEVIRTTITKVKAKAARAAVKAEDDDEDDDEEDEKVNGRPRRR